MPRKGGKKKRTYARRGARRGKIYGAAAGQLWKDVKMLKSIVNVEYKVAEQSTVGGAVGNTPNVLTLNALQRGDDYNQRNGRSVKWTSLYSRMTFTANSTATAPVYVRAVLFWAKDPDAVAPTPTQMFGVATPSVNAMMNLNLRKDFVILRDMLIKVVPPTGAGEQSQFRKLFLKLNQHTIYNAGNIGNITDIESYSLHWFIWGSSPTASNYPTFDIQNRLRFVDN